MDDLISRQEAIDALNVEISVNGRFNGKAVLAAYINSIEKRLKGIPAEQRWIPCNEKMPSISGAYLVSGGLGVWICMFTIINISESKHIGGWSNHADRPVVKAWMPLPEPYKLKEAI